MTTPSPDPPSTDVPAEMLARFKTMSRSELLDEALRVAEQLHSSISQLFPDVPKGPEIDLSKLTLEEQLALGDKNSAELLKLAYRINPHTTLDGMDKQLDEHVQSQDAASELLARMRTV